DVEAAVGFGAAVEGKLGGGGCIYGQRGAQGHVCVNGGQVEIVAVFQIELIDVLQRAGAEGARVVRAAQIDGVVAAVSAIDRACAENRRGAEGHGVVAVAAGDVDPVMGQQTGVQRQLVRAQSAGVDLQMRAGGKRA